MSSKDEPLSDKPLTDMPRGAALLRDAMLNKGTAFTEEERDALGLRGLLPPRIHTQDEQVLRVMENFRKKPDDLSRYIHLLSVQDRSETLFYRVLIDHLEEMMPVVYTPTVGQACQEYGHILRGPRGLFITANDRGKVADVLRNWPRSDVRIIVVTDGERILGLGDLGADGMGIPVGKLSLYTACGGVDPRHCLPVTLDVGTNNESLLYDPLYIGIKRRRLRGRAYDDLVEEFVTAADEVFPGALVQFEDFANANAFRFLQKYRNRVCAFNDDIQGTGAVALAGLYGAMRITGNAFADQKVLFLGAGEAGMGIADLIVAALKDEGLSEDEARGRCWFVDSKGLVVASRSDLNEHKQRFAHDHAEIRGLAEAVDAIRPTILIGASGVANSFTKQVIQKMAACNDRPVIFALSNPTSKAECTAEDAYTHSDGRAVFASGSPFAPVTYKGQRFVPGQGNNAYIFPSVGLATVACGIQRLTDEMFYAAAKTLSTEVSDTDISTGLVYPPLSEIRYVSVSMAVAIAEIAYEQGHASVPRPDDLQTHIENHMYHPEYSRYV